jgi:hypothetical protein
MWRFRWLAVRFSGKDRQLRVAPVPDGHHGRTSLSYPQDPRSPYQPQQQQGGYPQPQGDYGNYPVPAGQGYPPPQGQAVQALVGLQMKRRNPAGVWLGLPLITLGIYNLVWFFKVHAELSRYDRRIPDSSVTALLSALFGAITLGIWPLIMFVKLGGHIAQAQRAAGLQPTCSGGIGFLLGIFGFGTLYYQINLNKVIDVYQGAPEGAQVPLAA